MGETGTVICRGGDGTDHEAYWRDDNTCSFCGSVHPDVFVQALHDSVNPTDLCYVDPTTKAYKFYICRGDERQKFYTWHAPDQAWIDHVNAMMPHVAKFSRTKMERQVNEALKAAGIPTE